MFPGVADCSLEARDPYPRLIALTAPRYLRCNRFLGAYSKTEGFAGNLAMQDVAIVSLEQEANKLYGCRASCLAKYLHALSFHQRDLTPSHPPGTHRLSFCATGWLLLGLFAKWIGGTRQPFA